MDKPKGANGEVRAWLESYAPQSVPAELWERSLRGFVVSGVLALEPAGLAIAGRYTRLLTRLATCRNFKRSPI